MENKEKTFEERKSEGDNQLNRAKYEARVQLSRAQIEYEAIQRAENEEWNIALKKLVREGRSEEEARSELAKDWRSFFGDYKKRDQTLIPQISALDMLHMDANEIDKELDKAKEQAEFAKHVLEGTSGYKVLEWGGTDRLVHACPNHLLFQVTRECSDCGTCDGRVRDVELGAKKAGLAAVFKWVPGKGYFVEMPPIPEGESVGAFLKRSINLTVLTEEEKASRDAQEKERREQAEAEAKRRRQQERLERLKEEEEKIKRELGE